LGVPDRGEHNNAISVPTAQAAEHGIVGRVVVPVS
jgi:hypothetical protein